jgi:hypothetical protein
MVSHLDQSFDEVLLKEVNRLVTEHTLASFCFDLDIRC